MRKKKGTPTPEGEAHFPLRRFRETIAKKRDFKGCNGKSAEKSKSLSFGKLESGYHRASLGEEVKGRGRGDASLRLLASLPNGSLLETARGQCGRPQEWDKGDKKAHEKARL